MSNLSKLIAPKSVAIIGASSHPEKVGFQIVKNIVESGYKGKIFPVNIKKEEILGYRSASSILEIKDAVELAVIVLPRDLVLPVARECIQKGVSSIVVISAGFAEIDEKGRELQEELTTLCKTHNISLLGPNCLGFINTALPLNATFAKDMPAKGGVGLISQSGAIISSIIDWSAVVHLGFSQIFSTGNKALVDETDFLELLYNDRNTKVVIAYIESLVVTDRLTKILKGAKNKPTVILFGGQSLTGQAAAQSHTGSIISKYKTIKTYLSELGVLMAEDLNELLTLAKFFAGQQEIKGNRLAVITNAGGPAIATIDSMAKTQLVPAALTRDSQQELVDKLLFGANVKTPIDLLGNASAKDYELAISLAEKDRNVDGIIVLLTPQSGTQIEDTAKVVASYRGHKPLVASFIGGKALLQAKDVVNSSHLYCNNFPEDAVRMMNNLYQYNFGKITPIPALAQGKKEFHESAKFEILKDYHLPVVSYLTCETKDELVRDANKIGYPVVLKTADATAHKIDQNGVIVNITNDQELTDAARQVGLPAIVGKMIKKEHEIFLGLIRDEKIGVSTAFGTGGIYSEMYSDFAYRINLADEKTAKEMIAETIMGRLLDGARNQRKFDLDALAKLIVNANWLMNDYENISEIDFNPIIASKSGYYIVDARIITRERENDVR